MGPGLSSGEARRLLIEHGPNVLAEPPRPSHLRQLAANLLHLFALLLWGGAALAFVAGIPELGVAIVVVVLVNAAFAFAQEYRAERASEALRRMLPQRARVRRDGVAVLVPAEELVPGDLLLLESGDRVSADGRVLERHDLRVDRSALTGESRPVDPGDAVEAGTHVVRGSAAVEVTATGMATAFGRIAELAQRTEQGRSPLEREVDHVTRLIAMLVLGLGVAFFLVAGWLGMGLTERFVFAIGVMVANVPEGAADGNAVVGARDAADGASSRARPAPLLGRNARRDDRHLHRQDRHADRERADRGARVDAGARRLRGRGRGLRAVRALSARRETRRPAAAARAASGRLLCNDARVAHGCVVGDPTEGALVVLAEKGGLHHAREVALRPRLAELPFDSERKRMTTAHTVRGRRVA